LILGIGQSTIYESIPAVLNKNKNENKFNCELYSILTEIETLCSSRDILRWLPSWARRQSLHSLPVKVTLWLPTAKVPLKITIETCIGFEKNYLLFDILIFRRRIYFLKLLMFLTLSVSGAFIRDSIFNIEIFEFACTNVTDKITKFLKLILVYVAVLEI